MFRIIQIDPENLSININAGALSAHDKSEQLFAFLDLVSANNLKDALEITTSIYGADLDLLHFSSTYLHELRHFADLLISPFGFYRIRTAFEFYINFPNLLWANDCQVPVPLMSGMDPIVRSVIGLDEKFIESDLYHMGRTALSRRNVINKQNHFDNVRSEGRVGGDRILEGLAYITQFDYLFNIFDFETGKKIFPDYYQDFTGTQFDLAYRWFTPTVHQLHPGEAIPNNRLIYAILFASLCGHIAVLSKPRKGGARPAVLMDRDIGENLPSTRYYHLINYFLQKPQRSLESDAEAYQLVDNACKQLFGRSILSEIKMDIDYTAEMVEHLRVAHADTPPGLNHLDVSKCLGTLNDYRLAVFERLSRRPDLLLSSSGFVAESTKVLKPSLIYNYPQGLDASIPPESAVRSKWIGLIDRTLQPAGELAKSLGKDVTVIYSFWSPLAGELGYHKGMDKINLIPSASVLDDEIIAAFQTLYGIYSPVYRWLLFGNKYQTMLEVENDNLPDALGIVKTRVVYDNYYQLTSDIALMSSFHRFYQRDKYKCDICCREISPENGFIVSSRTIRQNDDIRRHYTDLGEETYFQWMVKDWSDWLICNDDMLWWGFPIPCGES